MQSDDSLFDKLLEIVTLAVAKRNNDVPEEVTLSQCSYITLGYSAKGNAFDDLKSIRVTSQSTGIIVLEICILFGRQTITE